MIYKVSNMVNSKANKNNNPQNQMMKFGKWGMAYKIMVLQHCMAIGTLAHSAARFIHHTTPGINTAS